MKPEAWETLLRRFAPEVIFVEIRTEWAAVHPGHRERLRARLAELLPAENADRLRDLSAPPLLREGFCSISHCTELGGLVVARTPVGLDLEALARIRPALVAQVSSMEEFAAFPRPELLWPAKEAAFKCLTKTTDVRGVQDIELRGGTVDGEVAEFFVLRAGDRFFPAGTWRGIVTEFSGLCVAMVLGQ